ncbi:MAG: hypothetical protein QXZ17_04770, partial [Nitrososphaerota archaeon]
DPKNAPIANITDTVRIIRLATYSSSEIFSILPLILRKNAEKDMMPIHAIYIITSEIMLSFERRICPKYWTNFVFKRVRRTIIISC